jgi:heterodisulfide reductase subunit B
MARIGYYPGCSLHGTAAEYDVSLRAVCQRLGIELTEIPDWVCCGATSAHAIDHAASTCLAADTLAKAHRASMDEILAPCAMCYSRLATAVRDLRARPELRSELAGALGSPRNAPLESIRIRNLLHWLESILEELLNEAITQPLKGLKVACYYGCLLVRPPQVTGEKEVEAPRLMEQIVSRLGANPVRWSMQLECCGGAFALSRKEVVLRQCRSIYDAARRADADVICTACPMCQANLDMRQGAIGVLPADRVPILYLTQLAGLALGVSRSELGIDSHFVSVEPVLAVAAYRSNGRRQPPTKA